jgi:hypothetical protein
MGQAKNNTRITIRPSDPVRKQRNVVLSDVYAIGQACQAADLARTPNGTSVQHSRALSSPQTRVELGAFSLSPAAPREAVMSKASTLTLLAQRSRMHREDALHLAREVRRTAAVARRWPESEGSANALLAVAALLETMGSRFADAGGSLTVTAGMSLAGDGCRHATRVMDPACPFCLASLESLEVSHG